MRERTSVEYKEAMIKKLLSSPLSDRQFAIEEGIAFSTLHKWKTAFRVKTNEPSKPNGSNAANWSSEEKFATVLETASLSEVEFGEYCRRKGLYPEHIAVWKQACIQGNMKKTDQKKQAESSSKADKKRIKELERELARKEKAFAEAAALLVLRKKLDALWEEDEDV